MAKTLITDKTISVGIFLIMTFSWLFLPWVNASEYEGPEVISPSWRIGAPWESIIIGLNISEESRIVSNVTLYYSINSTKVYNEVPMNLIYGDNSTGHWEYEIPRQPNGTDIYFYVNIFYTNGDSHTPIFPWEPRFFRIRIPSPSLRISYLGIESIDIKKLTVDIRCSIEVQDPIDAETRTVWLYNKYSREGGIIFDTRIIQLPVDKARRFYYYNQTVIRGLMLIGDATKFPFDDYSLYLEFKSYGSEKADLDVGYAYFTNPQEYYRWHYSYNGSVESYDSIEAELHFNRRPQSASWFIISFIASLLMLGGSLLLDSSEQLTHRLTIYLGLIVFLLTFNLEIQRFVPERGIGINFAEIIFQWLGLFMSIYLISSLLSNLYLRDIVGEKRLLKCSLIDLIPVTLSFFLIFQIKVVDAQFYFQRYSRTLFSLIPNNYLKIIVLLGLSYGVIIRLLKLTFRSIIIKIKKLWSYLNKITTQQTPHPHHPVI